MKVQIQKLDEANKNGRIYTSTEMQTVVNALKGKALLGTIGMPPEGKIALADVSHAVNELSIEDGYLVGKATILKTPKGELLQKLLEADDLSFRMIGTGKVGEDGVVSEYTLLSVVVLPKDTTE